MVHPRTHAVGVIALDDGDRLLLVGQYRYTLSGYSWEIPEGGVPIGDDVLDGARREPAEETGFRADTWRELMRFSLANSTSDETGVLYVATGLHPGTADPDETEALELRWVSFEEALEGVRSGDLFDAMTQLEILRVGIDSATQQR